MANQLFVCAMPIGNLQDTTHRVFDVLANVPTIFCEDTRVTKLVLQRLGILSGQSLVRMDQYQEKRSLNSFDSAIQAGDVAFVTDAGSPGVSDPGGLLVAHARETGVPVVLLPGPSALATFISGCGVLLNDFYFGGFLPKKEGDLYKALQTIIEKNQVGIWFESPKRITSFCAAIADINPTIQIVVAKELTKAHEQFVSGSAKEVLQKILSMDCRGEWVVMVDSRLIKRDNSEEIRAIASDLNAVGLTGKQVKALAHLFDCKKNELYDVFQAL
ncbi:MAG: 16S rRNA (cytidine(1402)-2'-O)-methyltransferase [Candidatus Marinamargulisbacteria bacterium]